MAVDIKNVVMIPAFLAKSENPLSEVNDQDRAKVGNYEIKNANTGKVEEWHHFSYFCKAQKGEQSIMSMLIVIIEIPKILFREGQKAHRGGA